MYICYNVFKLIITKNMYFKKKLLYIASIIIIITFIINVGIKVNNKIEWQMAVEASAGMPVQLGITSTVITQCLPSCQNPSGTATCCAPQTNNCAVVVPGSSGSYDTACPLFSDARGTQAGGTGSDALLSNQVIAKAGLSSGGQFIYGGTINNMSLMSPGSPNVVLASAGGCYGCMAKASLKEKAKKKFVYLYKYIIAGFKDD